MAEMMAENYHNIWAKKKKMELEAKGNINYKVFTVFGIWENRLKKKKKRNNKVKLPKKKQQSIYS